MAAADLAGVSSLGVVFSYGLETEVGVKPSVFTKLSRCNSIGEINLTPNTIDASALEDLVERSVAGRTSTGGTFDVKFNITDTVKDELTTMIEAYKAAGDKKMWFQTSAPGLTDAFFVVGQPTLYIPQPNVEQNGLLTVTIPITIEDYKGMSAKVAVTE